MIGLYVKSWHHPHRGTPVPYIGKIVKDLHNYWILDVDGVMIRSLKGACSTAPTKTKPRL